MTEHFEYHAGATPLLISIPHDGRSLPPAIAERMTECARELPDTDWHVGRLYEFAKSVGASIIAATYSRYVIDLNRSDTDEVLYQDRFVTGLCPSRTFAGKEIYHESKGIAAGERPQRIAAYWRPYHEKIAATLNEIKQRFGYALLWDAHSIPSEVPLLFEGELPELNFGTNEGRSCAKDIVDPILAAAGADDNFSMVIDGRFKGGFITRRYGVPADDVHAIQLELAQRCYMIEASREFDEERATRLRVVLARALQTYLSSAESLYR